MNVDTDFEIRQLPCFLDKTELIMKYMQGLSFEEAKSIWKCNDKIARNSLEYFSDINLKKRLTPALLAYEGIQYQYMAPNAFDFKQWDYIENHLNILSGFYGLLRPLDGIVPYRLEMQAKVKLAGYNNLYDYWGDALYRKLYENTDTILNLASKEYSKCIEKYLARNDKFITCTFGEYKEGKIITKGTLAKMARGEMVRYLAEEKIEDISEIKNFRRLNFRYCIEESTKDNIVFIKE